MARQIINTGTSELAGDGESIRSAFQKVNANFNELYINTDLANLPSHLLPASNLSYDLGSSSRQWRSLYVGTSTIYIGGASLSVFNGNLTINGSAVQGETGNIQFRNDSLSNLNGIIFNNANQTTTATAQISIPSNSSGSALTITNNGRSWGFNSTGSLTFPDGTIQTTAARATTSTLVNGTYTVSLSNTALAQFPAYSGGSLFIQGPEIGSVNSGIAVSAANDIILTSNIFGSPKQWTFGNDGTLTLPGGTDTIASNTGGFDLSILGIDQETVLTVNFGRNGALTVPNAINFNLIDTNTGIIGSQPDEIFIAGAPNATVRIAPNDGANGTFLFGVDGSLRFPDGTIQTTAFNGTATGSTVTTGFITFNDNNIIGGGTPTVGTIINIPTTSGGSNLPDGSGTYNSISVSYTYTNISLFDQSFSVNFNDGQIRAVSTYTVSGNPLILNITLDSSITPAGQPLFPITLTSPNYAPAADLPLTITVAANTWTFNLDGTTRFPSDRIQAPQGQTIQLYASTTGTDINSVQVNSQNIDIIAQNSNDYSWAELFLNNTDTSAPVAQIRVNANGGTEKIWDFNSTGNLLLPAGGAIETQLDENFLINVYATVLTSPPGPAAVTYVFNGSGKLEFPTVSGFVPGLSSNSSLDIIADTSTWTLDQTGITYFPDNLALGDRRLTVPIDESFTITTSFTVLGSPPVNGNQNNWTFNPDGTLRFPDNTIQATAFTGLGTRVTSITAGTGTFINTSTGAVTIWTTATGSGVTSITAGTGTFINTSTGAVTIWTTATSSGSTLKETFGSLTTATGVVTHDCTTNRIFYHQNISADFTANFTNLGLSSGEATSVSLILVQGATARMATGVRIANTTTGINLVWQGSVSAPAGNANRTDVVSFSIICTATNAYTVMGMLTSFGGV